MCLPRGADPTVVCVTAWPPYIMPANWATGANGSALPFADVFARSPPGTASGTPLDPHDPYFPLDGFDIQFAQLVLGDMMGVGVRFLPLPSWVEAYLSLRSGACHLFASGLELERTYATCDASCPFVPATPFNYGDYDYAGGWSPRILAAVCCLDYSAPYVFDGFGLLSLAPARGTLVSIANSPIIINVGMFLLLTIFLVGWLTYAIETLSGRNTGGTVGRWVYWSITAFSGVGFGGARARARQRLRSRADTDALNPQTLCRCRARGGC